MEATPPAPLRRPSLAELKERCLKTIEATDSRLLYRPISIRLTWFLVRTPLSPNGATTLGLLAGLAGAWLLVMGQGLQPLWGILLFQLAVVFDHVDGEIARAKSRQSPGGHFYDSAVLEVTLNILLFACLPWMVWNQTGDAHWIAVASAMAVAKGINVAITQYRGVMTLRDQAKAVAGGSPAPAAPAKSSLPAKVASLVWGIKNATNVTTLVIALDLVLDSYGWSPVATQYGLVTPVALWTLGALALLLVSILWDLYQGSRGRYAVHFPVFR